MKADDKSVHDLREGVPTIVAGVGKNCEFVGQPHHTYADDAVAMALRAAQGSLRRQEVRQEKRREPWFPPF